MNKAVTDVITSYKPRNINALRDQQIALTPCLDPYIIDTQVFEYIYDNQRTLVNPAREACYRLKYMYIKNIEPRVYIEYATSRHNLDFLVAENIVDPFLLFINGKMVPWHMIKVIMTHEEYHLLCEADTTDWLKEFNDAKSIQIIHLPSSCVYVNFPIGDADNRVFGFDHYGNYTTDVECQYSILNESSYMYFVKESTTAAINAHIVDTDVNVKYYPNNVILFRNNVLDTNSIISFDSTLMTINDGLNPDGEKLDFIVFKDIRTKEKVDNIKHAKLSYIQPYIQKQNAGEEVPEYITDLQTEFDFEMSRKKDYQTNVDESIDYIINYNASLFEDAYLQNKNLTVEEKDGQWVLDNLREDGTLMIPRKHGEFTDEYILMLVNGVLYEFYYMMKYTPDYCIIPIKDIKSEDVIEFMRFDDINNNTFDIVVNQDDDYVEYDPNYINTDMVLFSTIPPTEDFKFPEDGLQHFPIDYTLEYDESGKKFRIRFEDSRYYGQKLKLVYKHQFRHYWFDITQAQATDNYCVDLGTKFMYCHDYSKFLVFFNGRRLSTDQYRLCLPVRSTTPFYRFELYLTMYVAEGDRVDVIYTPSLLKDVVLIPEIEEDGKITVDKSEITYSLTKNLYMVWANGKKIPASKIANIDSTHIRIIDDIETLKYVCITKFLPDIDELTEVFQTSTALWDHIMSKLTDDEISQILNYNTTIINNNETDMYANSVHIRSVMLELIREKYIMNAGVDTTEPFVYDYLDVDDTAVSVYDSAGNALLDSADANVTENIDGIEREWP